MKLLFVVGGVLCLLAAGAMYLVGCTDPHLTGLKATFWLPIPLGVILLVFGTRNSE